MGFHWGADLPGDGRLLTRIPRPFSHIADAVGAWWHRIRGGRS